MKNLIHKTNKSNYDSIKDHGLKIRQDQYGRFGYGVYFMIDDSFGEYGDGLSVICDVDSKYIYQMSQEEVMYLYPEVYYDEDGDPDIQDFVKQMDYKGVAIPYSNGDVEVVIYDENIIKIKDFKFSEMKK